MPSSEKTDKHLDALGDSLAEAWLRQHLLTRFVRFMITLLVVFLATTAFVQSTQRSACVQAQKPIAAYVSYLRTQSSNAQTALDRKTTLNPDSSRKTVEQANKQIAALKGQAYGSCNDRYPLFPIIG